MKKLKNVISIVCVALMLSVCTFMVGCGGPQTSTTALNSDADSNSAAETTAAKEQATNPVSQNAVVAVIDIKDYGKITVALDPDSAPITVDNFVKLVKDGFYDGLTFHRIMEGFMMQGGDPEGTGMGGSEKTIKGEFSQNGVQNNLSHTRGAISMARSMDPDSASSQFFIVHKDSQFLDGQYACFGYVTEGIEVVDKVCKDAQPTDDNGTIPKENQPVINSIKIVE